MRPGCRLPDPRGGRIPGWSDNGRMASRRNVRLPLGPASRPRTTFQPNPVQLLCRRVLRLAAGGPVAARRPVPTGFCGRRRRRRGRRLVSVRRRLRPVRRRADHLRRQSNHGFAHLQSAGIIVVVDGC